MTNTTEEHEVKVCMDCCQVLFYNELSGIADVDAHLLAMDRVWPFDTWRAAMAGDCDGDDEFCGSCGTHDTMVVRAVFEKLEG